MKELIAIQAELKVPKNQKNQFGNYNYRSAEDITEAVKPLAANHGCFLTMEEHIEMMGQAFVCKDYYDFGYEDKDGIWHPDIREIEVVKGLRYFDVSKVTLTNSAGETVSCTSVAEHPEFKKGMDPAQVSGATSSYARKYALGGLFALDDIRDPDATNDHGRQEPRRHGRGSWGNAGPGNTGNTRNTGDNAGTNGAARDARNAAPVNPAPAPVNPPQKPPQNPASSSAKAPEDKPQTTAEKQLAFMAQKGVSKQMIEDAMGKPFEQLDAKDNTFLREVVKLMLHDKLGFEDAVEQQCRIEADNHPEAAQ